MAVAKIKPQNYPRINNPFSRDDGLLDTSLLHPHVEKISAEQIKQLVLKAIQKANLKSSRESIAIPENAAEPEKQQIYRQKGKELFQYFKKYYDDPATMAQQLHRKHYRTVGIEQFRNQMVQRGRMNSGWRYQFLIQDCANQSGRFQSVSGIGTSQGDFNAVIEFSDSTKEPLNLYVSVKNRRNTLGGQDWPKAIEALEIAAIEDRNRTGPYCCVFAIVMDRGQRTIKVKGKTKQPHSFNTELWFSDFVWPFFANYSYEEMMQLVLEVLLQSQRPPEIPSEVEIPEEVLASFGDACFHAGLTNQDGFFDDPYKLVTFFVNGGKRSNAPNNPQEK